VRQLISSRDTRSDGPTLPDCVGGEDAGIFLREYNSVIEVVGEIRPLSQRHVLWKLKGAFGGVLLDRSRVVGSDDDFLSEWGSETLVTGTWLIIILVATVRY
jgi:hypothetical protein